MTVDSNTITRDSLFNGKLTIYQYKKGYRFSIDAVILANITECTRNDLIIDLGTGCGIIPLILAYRGKGRRIVGVEIQEDLAEIARKNVEENGFDSIIDIHRVDVRKIKDHFEAGTFDLVVSNPPYRPVKTGRINPESQKAIARHELTMTLEDTLSAAAYLLKNSGTLSMIYPAWRLDDLIVLAHQYNLRAKKLTCIHSQPGTNAELVHIVMRKKVGRELIIAPPLFVYESGEKRYTPQVEKFYEP
ncbi:MAG: tRNA1(Val) (adenine(37)-N6)-methyltransferase [Thermodesulforhabdaceae bacterium]|jgi:tRNA1Val (adenine37-N6)-methyltransferase